MSVSIPPVMSEKFNPTIILASGSPRRSELLRMLGLEFQVIKPAPGAEPPCTHGGSGLRGLLDWCAAEDRRTGNADGEEDGFNPDFACLLRKAGGKHANVSVRLSDPAAAECLAAVASDVQNSAMAKASCVAGSEEVCRSASSGKPALVIGADTTVVCGLTALGKPGSTEEAEAMLRALSGRWHHVITGVAVCLRPQNVNIKSCAVTAVKFRRLSEPEIKSYAATGNPLDKAGAYGIQELGSLFVQKIDGCYHNVVGLPLTVLNAMCADCGAGIFDLRHS